MDRTLTAQESGPSSKRRKSNDNRSRNDQGSVANDESLPDIFKLDSDCFEELFNYLPLNDLRNIGATCKQLQQIAGHCFRQNYRAHEAYYYFDRLYNVVLTMNNIERMKQILTQIQCLKVFHCEVDDSFFGTVLVHCQNMKCLCVDEWTLKQVQDDWLHRSYPTLEHFELMFQRHGESQGLKSFFELNPNVRTFAITKNGLWLNRTVIMNTQFALDTLAIDYDYGVDLEVFCEFLNELYDCGIYKNLHFYFGYSLFDQGIVNRLVSLKALVKLRVKTDAQHINLSAFVELQELCISNSSLVADLRSLPNILTNLKRIYFAKASIDDILPFISGSMTLNRINVLSLLTGTHFDQHDGVLDLAALNRQRKRLNEPRRITIYVDEHVYLATKRAMKRTDFDLIKMIRADSHEWNHEFACDNYRFDR